MVADRTVKIVIRHISGARANSIEEIPAKDEIRLGRDRAADIVFDAPADDVVSRSHAIIRCSMQQPPTFTIEDLGSSNGTFLNKKPLKAKSELLPDDQIMLGKSGPTFAFDLKPRPSNLAARTVMIDAQAAADATRVIAATQASTAVGPAADTKVGTRATTMPAINADDAAGAKTGIGRETMLNEIAQVREETLAEVSRQQTSSNRLWVGGLAAIAVVAAAAGGALYWRQVRDERANRMALEQVRTAAETQGADAAQSVSRRLGMSPQDIVRQYGSSTARVTARWRLYDPSGQPVFIKRLSFEKKLVPVFVKRPDGSVTPLLTTDDDDGKNWSIGGEVQGTAFVVSDSGFLLTNRHITSRWTGAYFGSEKIEGVMVEETGNAKRPYKFYTFDDSSDVVAAVKAWTPAKDTSWPLFASFEQKTISADRIPSLRVERTVRYVGRNESISVRFEGQRLETNASLVRTSSDNDVALLKIDSPQALQKIPMADGPPSPGERVIVLGYPAFGAKIFQVSETVTTDGKYSVNPEEVPRPYITEGIVAQVMTKVLNNEGIKIVSNEGNTIRLTINSTGPGNSGGPVFNSAGQVIGIFTFGIKEGMGAASGAVPIQYGADLMASR